MSPAVISTYKHSLLLNLYEFKNIEALEIAASIIGVIQLAGKATSLSYGYIGGVKRASVDIQQLVDELIALSKALIALKEYMD